jgi:glutamate racemase
VESGAYSRAVRGLDAGVTVFSAATPKFVDVVEAGLHRGHGALEDWLAESSDVFIRPSFHELARDYLDPLKRSGVDTLVLGCTHFPLLSAAIQGAMGSNVTLISSAAETASEVQYAQKRRQIDTPDHSPLDTLVELPSAELLTLIDGLGGASR